MVGRETTMAALYEQKEQSIIRAQILIVVGEGPFAHPSSASYFGNRCTATCYRVKGWVAATVLRAEITPQFTPSSLPPSLPLEPASFDQSLELQNSYFREILSRQLLSRMGKGLIPVLSTLPASPESSPGAYVLDWINHGAFSCFSIPSVNGIALLSLEIGILKV